ncbi:AAA family ATPase [Microcella daejeonensis]|uniref:AAA family ATPase n=1 Tax=Microcella daejeonensis TaxID=2994971 RepID=A0A9E8MK92_9MICO|nr:AAA family ATPase [Microcella daejeonensis]WAB81078.1 AAA family ATPase [Microcella daejeonensis]
MPSRSARIPPGVIAAVQAEGARVVVAGVSGAGKTTLARAIGARTGIRHVEIDALHWGAGWTPRPEFLDDVRSFVATDSWITEWQYRRARDLVVARATVLIWLDLPFPLVLARVVRRTARRRRRREKLWNGNVEPGLRHAVLNREGVIRWSIATRRKYAPMIAALRTTAPHVEVIRLRWRRDARRLLRALDPEPLVNNSGDR